MTHPTITHINDVLPSVKDRPDFVVADKGDYTVVDYVYALPDSFDDPIRRECRGIKFGKDGRILARPFHKFFNLGEREETQPSVVDFAQPHTVTEKLDGTMIHPAIVNREVVFMTRMGRTEHALKAERHLTPAIADAVKGSPDLTFLFEWTAPDNRIVVRYDESALTLLAARSVHSGRYLPKMLLYTFAYDMGVPHVTHHDPQHSDASAFLAYARAVHGAEGFVVRFDSGLWVKAKGEDYVLKHRAKDSIMHEKNILAIVLNGGIDDVIPLLEPHDVDEILEYKSNVDGGIDWMSEFLYTAVNDNADLSQKDFALTVVPKLPVEVRGLAFKVRAGTAPQAAIREHLAANCNTQTQVDALRPLHGAVWRY